MVENPITNHLYFHCPYPFFGGDGTLHANVVEVVCIYDGPLDDGSYKVVGKYGDKFEVDKTNLFRSDMEAVGEMERRLGRLLNVVKQEIEFCERKKYQLLKMVIVNK